MKLIAAVLLANALGMATMATVARDSGVGVVTESVGSIGSVTFTANDGVLALVGADAGDGWEYTVTHQDGTRLTVMFADGTGNETRFDAAIRAGEVVIG